MPGLSDLPIELKTSIAYYLDKLDTRFQEASMFNLMRVNRDFRDIVLRTYYSGMRYMIAPDRATLIEMVLHDEDDYHVWKHNKKAWELAERRHGILWSRDGAARGD